MASNADGIARIMIVAAIGIAAYLLSFLAFNQPWLNDLCFAAVLIAAGWLSWRSLEYGVYILIAELALGGMGYLWSLPICGWPLSLRLGLFAVVLSIWLIKELPRFKNFDFSNFKDRRIIALVIFLLIIALAAAVGLLVGHPLGLVFSDANGYLYLALAVVFLAANLKMDRFKTVIFGASIASGLLTIVSLFIFAHGYAFVGQNEFYKWIRDAGIGEITLINAPLYRIFFQSQIYNLLALILAAAELIGAGSRNTRSRLILLWSLAFINTFALVVSQSRSFWVAAICVLFILLPLMGWRLKLEYKKIGAVLFVIAVFIWLSNFAGQSLIGDYSTDFFTGRVGGASGTAAVSSRMAELAPAFGLIRQSPLIGHGFGQTVHFRSDDPRIKNSANPEGWTDAVMIEWGYLDFAVKAGLIGLAALLYLLFVLGWPVYQGLGRNSDMLPIFLALAMVMVVNMFTPYLNHPLGLGLILSAWSLSKE